MSNLTNVIGVTKVTRVTDWILNLDIAYAFLILLGIGIIIRFAFILFLRGQSYHINVRCSNCGVTSIIKIPKGKKILEFLKSDKIKCKHCKTTKFSHYYKVNENG